MTLTLELPDDVAARLTALWPEEKEQICFGLSALEDALTFHQNETDNLISVVNQAIDDAEADIGMIDFDDLCRQWDAEKAARKAKEAA